jgi:hypothetical protein
MEKIIDKHLWPASVDANVCDEQRPFSTTTINLTIMRSIEIDLSPSHTFPELIA